MVGIGSARAQNTPIPTKTVAGVVLDKDTRRFISGVSVAVKEHPSIIGTTDAKGAFSVSIPGSSTRLRFTHPDMKDAEAVIVPRMRVEMSKPFVPHEFSIHAGVGLSPLWNYSSNMGNYESSIGIGCDVGVGYTYFFTRKWAISSGVGAAFFINKYAYDQPEWSGNYDHYKVYDGESDVYFSYKIKGYTETQRIVLLTIPLMVHFETRATATSRFYAALGGKVGTLGSIYYENSLNELVTRGKDISSKPPAEDDSNELEYITRPLRGFGTFNPQGSSGSIKKLNLALFASAEVGMKWALTNELSLYTGAYIDYGLNNILQDENKSPFITYKPPIPEPDEYIYDPPTSMLSAQKADNTPFVDKVAPVSTGIRLTLAFNKKPSKKSKVPFNAADNPAIPPVAQPNLPVDNSPDTSRIIRRRRTQVSSQRMEEVTDKQRLQRPINFEFDRSDLIPDSKEALEAEIIDLKQQLEEKIRILKKYPNWKIRIEGHTDDIGSSERNTILGKERAETAKNYMLERGIPAQMITETVSKAATEPLVPNTSEENRQKNRRVVIVVIGE